MSGDICKAVSVHRPHEQCIPFLYTRSVFATSAKTPETKYSELDMSKYVPWEFPSTCAWYCGGVLQVFVFLRGVYICMCEDYNIYLKRA